MNVGFISKKLYELHEFDRVPVSEKSVLGIGNFMGSFAGEHVAGTEFVIGMFFLQYC
jgi:hypothetical protein